MRWAQISDTGLVRTTNEDSLCISPETGLFAVADGMGGHQAGEVASSMALRILERELGRELASGTPPEKALVKSVKEANRSIYEVASRNPEWAGMGTTVTACLKRGNELYVAQVGDSRAYLIRDGIITRLTEDHSLVQEMVKNGGLTEEQAFNHPQRNVLTRALGIGLSLEVDLYRFQVLPGNLILICTDGLTIYLRPEEILLTISNSPDLESSLQNLLDRALACGGSDNITMILLEC
ncbi:MAG TPA: Stp1/IreP family PP2C-type Ser/Thr phosphatase [Bacillota bacterium]|nr:Stp1/IreP family PP2C-type Ser/Thr phosphatase [Peptococcaceae bacterium MAG4]NLW37467.1 Stp1/IreP family PP2C-type Ser/Thr phosphatase [Peptococcaceae bacterium]HPU35879.1 Stp1/IreP family PP2C-type Ser/Thr phosphatase [Bacillota bacterium]HPZ43766.1 Stp1/IreP family PP2C-type Ser/Thr phosphatase [Bacillota bacterium]HQD76187.1 Stp1/IreP family PP2C-type Ser/Thr phosphatase [Bacillota bacterium]